MHKGFKGQPNYQNTGQVVVNMPIFKINLVHVYLTQIFMHNFTQHKHKQLSSKRSYTYVYFYVQQARNRFFIKTCNFFLKGPFWWSSRASLPQVFLVLVCGSRLKNSKYESGFQHMNLRGKISLFHFIAAFYKLMLNCLRFELYLSQNAPSVVSYFGWGSALKLTILKS